MTKNEASRITPKLVAPDEGRRLAVGRSIYTIKAAGEDTGGAYSLMEMAIPPQEGPPPHTHSREAESFFILEGSLSFWVAGRKLIATPGSLVIAPPGFTHAFKNEGDKPARVLMLITPAGFEKFFQEMAAPLTGDESPPPEPRPPGSPERLAAAAAEYGLEINLPED